jgi:hypothetical protein
MLLPFDYIRLYKREDLEDDDEEDDFMASFKTGNDTGSLKDYEEYDATCDLAEIENIEPSVVSRDRVTVLDFKSGYKRLALISYQRMRYELRQARESLERKNLLTTKQ